MFRYAWHLLGRREDAEDATQATFLAVHGALAGGTAVLEPGAWVLRIARNECMGRLRQVAQRPAVGSLDGDFDPPAAGGVERAAELRDEMRTARQTLSGLPVPEREAFVLREWLGFETAEAALTMGLTSGDVDALAARARRSLVLAVGGLEPAAGCAGTQAALEAGSLDRAGKVHLLRCPVCRGIRRALRPPDAAARSLAPVAQRLAAVLPGFASGGGGIAAALTAKATAAPLLTKTAALVAAALVTGGAVEQAIHSTQPAHRTAAPAKARGAHAHASPSASAPTKPRTAVAVATPLVTLRRDAVAVEAPTRGGAAGPAGKRAASVSRDDRGSAPERHDSSGAGSVGGEHKPSGDDRSGSADGDHSAGGHEGSSGEGTDGGGDKASGSGDTGGTHDDHGDGDSSASGSAHNSDDTTSGAAEADEGDDASPAPADDTATSPEDTSAD